MTLPSGSTNASTECRARSTGEPTVPPVTLSRELHRDGERRDASTRRSRRTAQTVSGPRRQPGHCQCRREHCDDRAELGGQEHDHSTRSAARTSARTAAARTRASTASRPCRRCSSARRRRPVRSGSSETSPAAGGTGALLPLPPPFDTSNGRDHSTHRPDGPDHRHRKRAQGRGLHHAPPRRPAGEPDSAVRSRGAPGPGVHGLPDRLHTVVRREHVGRSAGDTAPHRTAPIPGPVVQDADEEMPRAQAHSGNYLAVRAPPRRACPPVKSVTTSPSRPRTATTSTTTRAKKFDCNNDGNYNDPGRVARAPRLALSPRPQPAPGAAP